MDSHTQHFLEHLRVATEDKRGAAPITIVFANSAYSDILDNWLRHALPFVGKDLIVFALDELMDARACSLGVCSILLPFNGLLDELWLFRVRVFEALVNLGVNFIHSDADAVWLADPRQYCSDLDVDLAISPGTVWPFEAVELWGFVLCCGFFCARATPKMASFLQQVKQTTIVHRDDQAALNRVLLKAGVDWGTDTLAYDVQEVMERQFRNYDRVVFGRTVSAFDLKLALLPQHLFQRVPRASDMALVKHPLTPKEPAAQISVLREHGCWRD